MASHAADHGHDDHHHGPLKFQYEDMDQQLKQRLKHKRRIILKNVQNVFSFTKLYDYFLFDKNT